MIRNQYNKTFQNEVNFLHVCLSVTGVIISKLKDLSLVFCGPFNISVKCVFLMQMLFFEFFDFKDIVHLSS